ncbi:MULTISPECIES: YpoC family protein [Bacillaceae]|uniref:YpoC-like domain-containing protein n=1 Tax=Evansella alkalicola TaxID=745819 RepID=A0ABS6JZ90_9BACI|nr:MULTISPECIES: hypothetical protein [Bacillaceae]MBU9723906.1 hypothetical protein [Bacillus alkalicola]
MTLSNTLIVPEPFAVLPFYENKQLIKKPGTLNETKLTEIWDGEAYFIHDILHYEHKLSGYEIVDFIPPWHFEGEEIKTQAINFWQHTGLPKLSNMFHQRDRIGARPLMLKHIAIYIQTIHWIQGKPVYNLQDFTVQFEDWKYSPVNFGERISFILKSPDHYHSFTQLSQLYEESNKKWALFLNRSLPKK